MKKRVLAYVEEQQLITEGDHVIVGLSGGADSVCLLLMLKNMQQEIGFSVEAVHINHNLRGQEALRDQLFVEKFCKNLDIKLTVESVDVAAWAQEEKLGLEEAGRKVRYEVFEKLAAQAVAAYQDSNRKLVGPQVKIALAHHQNDQAETMLYHLARGTDLTGLIGIRPKREQYIRPLLCMSRQEIESYLAQEGIDYVNDSSNAEDDYTRNKIRHHVVEYLEKEINPKAVLHMSETAQSLAELEEYLIWESRKKFELYAKNEEKQIELSVDLWKEPKVLVCQVLRNVIQLLAGSLKDITREHIQIIYELAEKEVGKEAHLPYGLIGKRTYSGIVIWKKEYAESDTGVDDICIKKDVELPLDFRGTRSWNNLQISVELLEGKTEEILENRYTKWLDYDKMKCTLGLRYRKTGDYIVVNQQGGTKKIKDYFIDQKIPKEERDQIPLFCCGQEVLWVVGHRMSEAYKVTAQTKQILKIQVLGGSYHE